MTRDPEYETKSLTLISDSNSSCKCLICFEAVVGKSLFPYKYSESAVKSLTSCPSSHSLRCALKISGSLHIMKHFKTSQDLEY